MKHFFIIFPIFLFSQTFQRDINPFPMILFEDELSAPFIGGFNKPNPRFLDWNEDGLIDLFLRDEDGYLQYYKNIGSASNPEFQLQTKTFQELYVGIWFSFLDFDFDGDVDLLCQTSGTYYISAYENVSGEFQLRTEQLLDDIGDPVFGSQADIPTLADIDGDNREDLFMGNQAGKVIYYSNIGTSDGLPVFQYITNYFQHINIIWFPPGTHARHGASALEFFDIDDNNTKDLFWGDLFQPSLFFLENIGTPQVPEIPDSIMFTSYPEEYPIVSAGFNAPRFADIDNDGDSELFVGVQTGQYGTDNIDNFWYYKNNGNHENPNFVFETKNFIQTLDLHSNSVPTFIDIDGDSDLDLFIGNELHPPTIYGTIYFFENVGNANEPSFTLMDTSYFGGEVGMNLAPTFADIDGDGDMDYFVGDWNGKIFYFENTGNPSQPSFTNSVEFLDIDLSGHSTPIFSDIDQDDDLDLFVGDKNGKIHYWENEGSATFPDFRSENEDYFPEFNLGERIIPWIYDYGDDGDLDFFIGNEAGQLFLLTNGSGTFELEEMTIFPYSGINIAPAVVDIDSDGKPELFIGSRTGGLQYFEMDEGLYTNSPIILPQQIVLHGNYPNPFNSSTTIKFELTKDDFVRLIIYDLKGRMVKQLIHSDFETGEWKVTWNGTDDSGKVVSAGIYLCVLKSDAYAQTRKMILLK
tara:strand:- start:340 stop:2415 length:2076 start_codon:yes stop_codon:yes gene_type:complete